MREDISGLNENGSKQYESSWIVDIEVVSNMERFVLSLHIWKTGRPYFSNMNPNLSAKGWLLLCVKFSPFFNQIINKNIFIVVSKKFYGKRQKPKLIVCLNFRFYLHLRGTLHS